MLPFLQPPRAEVLALDSFLSVFLRPSLPRVRRLTERGTRPIAAVCQ